MKWMACAAFGLEGAAIKDLKRLGAENIQAMNVGGATFEGDIAAGFRANLWLRTADRVMLVVGEFPAKSFEELFQGVLAVSWEDYIARNARFPVRARCVRSTLMSETDTQKIVKKAVVERLKRKYPGDWLQETGETYQIDVSIREDQVTVSLDASGLPLSKRGYRTWNGEAPIRETLAAGLVLASPWHPWQRLIDPCCGTGTLLVEAAFIALNRAPGLTREFAMENWAFADKAAMQTVRSEARQKYEECRERKLDICGSDIDPDAVELARRHVKQAGLEGRIGLEVRDMRDLNPVGEPGVFIANPPYGERLDNHQAALAVERQLGKLLGRSPGWKMCVISSDMSLEKNAGQHAARRRRYFNGKLECVYRIFE